MANRMSAANGGNFNDVAEFHGKMKQDYKGEPRQLDPEMLGFRMTFMMEELQEFNLAGQEGDLVRQADALVDLVYVAMGTAYLMGLPWELLWEQVHKANMDKEPGQLDATSAYKKFKVLKPIGWVKPEQAIRTLLEHFTRNPDVLPSVARRLANMEPCGTHAGYQENDE